MWCGAPVDLYCIRCCCLKSSIFRLRGILYYFPTPLTALLLLWIATNIAILRHHWVMGVGWLLWLGWVDRGFCCHWWENFIRIEEEKIRAQKVQWSHTHTQTNWWTRRTYNIVCPSVPFSLMIYPLRTFVILWNVLSSLFCVFFCWRKSLMSIN